MVTLPPVETTPLLVVRFNDKASPRLIELVKQRLQKCRINSLSCDANDDGISEVLYLTTEQHDLKLEAEHNGLIKTAKMADVPQSLTKFVTREEKIEITKPYNPRSKDDFTVSTEREENKFSGYDKEGLFNSSDRVRLLRSMLESITVSDEDEKTSLLEQELNEANLGTNFPKSFRINHKITSLDNYHHTYLCDLLRENDMIDVLAPVHIPYLRDKLWVESMRFLKRLPLQGLRDYYGEEVTYYFAWQEFYMYSLFFPGLSGLIINIIRNYRGHSIDECTLTPFHGLITFIWAIVFLKFWSRKESRLAYSWGTLKSQTEGRGTSSMRHGFKGKTVISKVTGKPAKYYSPVLRRLKYIVSALVTLVLLSAAFFVMILSLNLQGYISEEHDADRWGDGLVHPFHFPAVAIYAIKGGLFDPVSYSSYVPIMLHAAGVLLMNTGYSIVAERLTKWENHKASVSHKNSLILKRFFFEAFDAYLILFYLAFYEQDVLKVRSELISLFHMDTFRRLFLEGLVPFLYQKLSNGKKTNTAVAKKTDEVVKDPSLDQDIKKDEYEQFDDYIESVIQFGYVTLFASAYPLAAFVAIAACSIEYRLDLFKLTKTCMRPESVLRNDIGIWKYLLKSIVWLSAFTNCLIFSFSSMQMYQYLPGYFTLDKTGEHNLKPGNGWIIILIIFAIERFLIIFGILFDFAIPSTPPDVKMKERRRDFIFFQQNQSARSILWNPDQKKRGMPQDNPLHE